jgi:hypothetical protein
MFNNLLTGMKRRILQEAENAFLNHPIYAGNVRVTNKFPQKERVQYGVVLRNASGSQIRMSADNYMADLYSHVRLCKFQNYPGLSVEWIRENTNDITDYKVDEDLSSQIDGYRQKFTTSQVMVAGPGNTRYASYPGQIVVTLNGATMNPSLVDGGNRTFSFPYSPLLGSTLKVSYYYRTLVPPGYYVLDFKNNNTFTVGPAYSIENEVLIEKTTGLETSVTLASAGIPGTKIHKNTEELVLQRPNLARDLFPIVLIKDTDYIIDYATGIITFLHGHIDTGFRMVASYRYYTDSDLGPFPVSKFREIHNAVPGVVLCMGRRIVPPNPSLDPTATVDRQVVVVSQFHEQQAQIYGGHWEMALSLGVIAKDTPSMEEMTDLIVNYLWGVRKNQLEFEGITLNRVEATGETEEPFVENTGDMYYESSIDISVQTEWQRFIPYLYKLRHVNVEIEPDMGEILKSPVIGYEKVS